MNPKYRFPILNAIRGNRRLYAAICIPALIVAFAVAFSFESGSQAAVKKGQKLQKNRKVNIEIPGGLKLRPIDPNFADMQLTLNRKARRSSPISPSAIPAGTPSTSATFLPDDVSGSVTAIADTTGDFVPDANATETFFEADDPSSQLLSTMAFGSNSGKYYIGVVDFDGPNIGMGQIIVVDNSTGNFKATRNGMFSAGAGTPVGMAVQSTPVGDILYVLSVEFATGYFEFDDTDGLRLTAYLPGANGVPDGVASAVIFDKGDIMFGDNAANRSFGGLAVDSKGNLYLNIAVITPQPALGGVIVAISDSDGDMLPDTLGTFVSSSDGDANPITAASIVPQADGSIVVYGVTAFQNQPSQIVIYSDANGDFEADGAAKVFSTLPTGLRGAAGAFGDGTSSVSITRMGFADGQALVSLARTSGGQLSGSTLSSIKDNGTGVGGTPVTIIEGGSTVPFFTAVVGVPGRPADAVPPTVSVTSPNGGETATGNTMLPITFTSSDDMGVASHDIALSTDGGTTFPITIASGLSGTVQSFNFLIPGSLETTTARIQVTAKDGAGNMASDASDANFTIQKPTVADTMPPTVSITAPTAGSMLIGGSSTTIRFTSTDNVAVASHSIQFASDGTNFNTTVATGLPGSANSFQFTVPSTGSTNAAIRVQALDGAGNIGSATVGMLNVVVDSTKPTVTVTAPKTKDKLKGGMPFTVTFMSTDNIAVVSHEIQLSRDNGATFTTLNTGIPGTASSFQITLPNEKIKKAAIKVIARDGAGNSGEGVSGIFKVKKSK